MVGLVFNEIIYSSLWRVPNIGSIIRVTSPKQQSYVSFVDIARAVVSNQMSILFSLHLSNFCQPLFM